MSNEKSGSRTVQSVHGRQEQRSDPEFHIELARWLKESYSLQGLVDLYARFAMGEGSIDLPNARSADALMRRCIWRAAARRCGHGLQIGTSVGFKHIETFEIGDDVFIGSQAFIQGRYDGTTIIGNNVWIGPQAYMDARDLILGDYVGWGPGAKILGSAHTGIPTDVPIVRTDLVIKPVRVESEADIGTNATILPGVTIGRGAIVGAGAVVTADVAPYSIVAGVPARFVRWRKDDPADAAAKRHAHIDTTTVEQD